MEYEGHKDEWRTILNKSFEAQIEFLHSASLSDFMKGVTEILHGSSLNEVKVGAYRVESPPRHKDEAGNNINESFRAELADNGFLEVGYYRSVITPAFREVEAVWTVVRQRIWGSQHPPTWEARFKEGNEIRAEELELAEEEQLEFRAKLLDTLNRRNDRRRHAGTVVIRVVSEYL